MLVSFSIVLVILKKFAWQPILKVIKDREDSIQHSLDAAKRVKEEMAQLQQDNERILAEARKEREGILKEARDAKARILAEAKEKATEESHKLLESARSLIASEKAAAVKEIRNQVVSLSVEIAQKVLQEQLKGSSAQQQLAEKFVKDLPLN